MLAIKFQTSSKQSFFHVVETDSVKEGFQIHRTVADGEDIRDYQFQQKLIKETVKSLLKGGQVQYEHFRRRQWKIFMFKPPSNESLVMNIAKFALEAKAELREEAKQTEVVETDIDLFQDSQCLETAKAFIESLRKFGDATVDASGETQDIFFNVEMNHHQKIALEMMILKAEQAIQREKNHLESVRKRFAKKELKNSPKNVYAREAMRKLRAKQKAKKVKK